MVFGLARAARGFEALDRVMMTLGARGEMALKEFVDGQILGRSTARIEHRVERLRLNGLVLVQDAELELIESRQIFIVGRGRGRMKRSEEHTSELQSLMRISYAVFCLKTKQQNNKPI